MDYLIVYIWGFVCCLFAYELYDDIYEDKVRHLENISLSAIWFIAFPVQFIIATLRNINK